MIVAILEVLIRGFMYAIIVFDLVLCIKRVQSKGGEAGWEGGAAKRGGISSFKIDLYCSYTYVEIKYSY